MKAANLFHGSKDTFLQFLLKLSRLLKKTPSLGMTSLKWMSVTLRRYFHDWPIGRWWKEFIIVWMAPCQIPWLQALLKCPSHQHLRVIHSLMMMNQNFRSNQPTRLQPWKTLVHQWPVSLQRMTVPRWTCDHAKNMRLWCCCLPVTTFTECEAFYGLDYQVNMKWKNVCAQQMYYSCIWGLKREPVLDIDLEL